MKYLFGNWKMYLTHQESVVLASHLSGRSFHEQSLCVAVFPMMLSFLEVDKQLHQSAIKRGVQNIAWTPQGAYTGAISAHMVKDVGASYALVGHSERRYIFGETNEDIRKKIDAALEAQLIPVVCIGETATDKAENKTEYRLKKQLMKALEGLSLQDNQLIIAYEPVWAISQGGSGKPCPPLVAEERHAWIKEEIKQYTKAAIPVLYGGSVNPGNMLSYMSCTDIDGVLVGSASTTVENMVAMIEAADKL